ncbi:MAG: hypothetical protein WBP12_04895 [Candidatus Saccharimonas sp.]
MLHIPKRLHLPRFESSTPVALQPVESDGDELLQAIEASHEEAWQLEPMPDATELGEFWSGVQQDLHDDPTWFNFANDEE